MCELIFFNLPVLIFNSINRNRYNSHNHKIFGILNNFKVSKAILWCTCLNITAGDLSKEDNIINTILIE